MIELSTQYERLEDILKKMKDQLFKLLPYFRGLKSRQ